MKFLKKAVSLILVCVLSSTMLTACGGGGGSSPTTGTTTDTTTTTDSTFDGLLKHYGISGAIHDTSMDERVAAAMSNASSNGEALLALQKIVGSNEACLFPATSVSKASDEAIADMVVYSISQDASEKGVTPVAFGYATMTFWGGFKSTEDIVEIGILYSYTK